MRPDRISSAWSAVVLDALANDIPGFIEEVRSQPPWWWAGTTWTPSGALRSVDAVLRLEPKLRSGQLNDLDDWQDYALWLLCAYSRVRQRETPVPASLLAAMQDFIDEGAPDGVPLIARDGRLVPAWVLAPSGREFA